MVSTLYLFFLESKTWVNETLACNCGGKSHGWMKDLCKKTSPPPVSATTKPKPLSHIQRSICPYWRSPGGPSWSPGSSEAVVLAGGASSGLWLGAEGDALPIPLPGMIGPGNGLDEGIGGLGASDLSSIGGKERGVGATGGGGVEELDEPGRNVTVSGPPLPAACQCSVPPPIWAPNWKWEFVAGAACGSPIAGPHCSHSVEVTVCNNRYPMSAMVRNEILFT